MNGRYVVRATEGYRINPSNPQAGNARLTTTFYVADTLYCWREVGVYQQGRGVTRERARFAAERACAILNAAERSDAFGSACPC